MATIQTRLARLEGARGARPDADKAARFTALVVALDRLAARKASGDETAQAEIDMLAGAAR
jgi:hypothetical protein